MKRVVLFVGGGLLLVAALGVYRNLSPPDDLYAFTGEFAGCPARPDCVSSRAEDDAHRVAALAHTGDTLRAFSMLQEVVERMGGDVAHEGQGYLHAVFENPRLQLRDDLELLVHADGRIDVRSISRFGYRDASVHRARVEELRRSFEATP